MAREGLTGNVTCKQKPEGGDALGHQTVIPTVQKTVVIQGWDTGVASSKLGPRMEPARINTI